MNNAIAATNQYYRGSSGSGSSPWNYYYQHNNHKPQSFFKQENFYSPVYVSRYVNMLWDQTKQLPKEVFKQVEDMYSESGFHMEVRLHLASFVESKFMQEVQVDDSTAANLASQLLSQLDAKIEATPNDPDKFLMKAKLREMSDNLKVRITRSVGRCGATRASFVRFTNWSGVRRW